MAEISSGAGSADDSRTVLIWVVEGSWSAGVDVARRLGWADDLVTLLYVVEEQVTAAAAGAYAGLFGRPAQRIVRTGRIEREVVVAAAGVDLLIVARDGDLSRLGPRSLGRHTRFVVDHAPCPVLLVWPHTTPSVESIPPPSEHPPR